MKKREDRKIINHISVVVVVFVAVFIIISFVVPLVTEKAGDVWKGLKGELATLSPGEIAVSDGLYAYYRFEGNARDEFGVFNGVVHGASLTEGIYGQAYEFDSKGGISGTADYTSEDYVNADEDYINIPFTRGGGLDFSNREEITTSFWMNLDEIPSDNNGGSRPLYWEDLSTNDGEESIEWFATDNGDGTYSLSWIIINHLGEKRRSTCENIPYSEWHMFAGTFGRNYTGAYIDGTVCGIKHLSGLIHPTTSGNDWIISDASLDKKLGIIGKIDELRIYNRALDGYEITVLFSEEARVTREIVDIGNNKYSITLNIVEGHLLDDENMIIAEKIPGGSAVVVPDSWSTEPTYHFGDTLVWVFPKGAIPETINYNFFTISPYFNEFRGKWGLEKLNQDELIEGDDTL